MGGFKVLGVWPHPHRRTGFGRHFGWLQGEGFAYIAVFKDDFGCHAFAERLHLQPQCQRVGHAHAHAMQPAGKAVRTALTLIKLAACVQMGENQFDNGRIFFGVHTKGNAAPIVFYRHRFIGMENHPNLPSKTAECFVGGVIQHLLNNMQRVIRAGIHSRTLLDRF